MEIALRGTVFTDNRSLVVFSMNKVSIYESPACEIIQIATESNFVETQIDNPGIGGPGETPFE